MPKTTHSQSDEKLIRYPASGYGRLKQILAPDGPLPFSASTWWARVADGSFPQPVRFGARCTMWRWEDIHALIKKLSEQATDVGTILATKAPVADEEKAPEAAQKVSVGEKKRRLNSPPRGRAPVQPREAA